ncbi:MAG: inositol monophosphatase, partial [Acidimicrobiales bacterium]|nr:inositol monophosphatase [Acidimicrobiales bacterium]
MSDPVDREALRDLAVTVASRAAEDVRARAGAPDLRIASKSSATDPVTEVDRAVEARLVADLLAARPDDGVVG